jgi:acetyltransferase
MLDLDDVVAGLTPDLWRDALTNIVIRPIRPDDERALGAFFRSLSPRSRHRRFLAVMNELPAPLLARFARPDGRNEAAFVATAWTGSEEMIVGDARYTAIVRPEGSAEFALAVHDRVQGCGVGERLLRALLRRANQSGMTRLFGDVLPDNRPMLALARKCGFSERRSPLDPRLVEVQSFLHAAQPR